MKFLLIVLFFIIALTSVAQKEFPEFVSAVKPCTCGDSVKVVNPSEFVIDQHVFKRGPVKKIKRKLKLGISGKCLLVIDNIGNVKPYKIKSFIFSWEANGMATVSCIGNCILGNCNDGFLIDPTNILPFICNWKGPHFFFEHVVVEDINGKEQAGIIEPLTIIRIK